LPHPKYGVGVRCLAASIPDTARGFSSALDPQFRPSGDDERRAVSATENERIVDLNAIAGRAAFHVWSAATRRSFFSCNRSSILISFGYFDSIKSGDKSAPET